MILKVCVFMNLIANNGFIFVHFLHNISNMPETSECICYDRILLGVYAPNLEPKRCQL